MKCNPTVKDIFEFIDSLAPFSTQCDWDNSGMLVGDRNKTVKKIAVVLDITTEAIEKAIKMMNKRDIVILAGKGHEVYQEINGEKFPYDEREIIKNILGEKK